ncbi:hypothetical protein [Psychromonas sp. KJ10-2]|uniref:hypothetical protein n=1 Tax=Psychromonas sp. KJ10-2 TaxID=3391822 RepID=UPI0039B437EA
MDFVSLAVGFLVGSATGAAGTYFGNKYTDKRKKIEHKKDSERFFNDLWSNHQVLLTEMKQDLLNPEYEFHREFFILNKGGCFNHAGKYLAYFVEDHTHLEQQVKILESHGLIDNVTEYGKNVQKYQWSEPFASHLCTT